MENKVKIILVSALTAVLALTIVGFTIFHILINPRVEAKPTLSSSQSGARPRA